LRKTVVTYSLVLVVLIVTFKYFEYRFFVGKFSLELYIGLIAIGFTALGIWLGLKITNSRKPTINNQVNQAAIKELGISDRELDVLKLMVNAMSNQEIADQLFISLSTVKTHCSNLFVKLAVKRRTQAIQKAIDLELVKL